ncbi:MAG: DUF2911 domain-containing protein [Balneolaceae bacterium]
MKSFLKIGALAVFALLLTSELTFAQERGGGVRPSPNAANSQNIGATVVSVTYGRPGLKGRAMSTLAPAGKVWRTGANESTVITFSTDVMFGDKEVKAGTYSLYTIPGAEEWTVIINSKLSWGTQYDEAMDVARTTATVGEGSNLEFFEIYFDTLSAEKAHLNLHWGTTKVAVPVTVK